MTTSSYQETWDSLADEEYRREYAADVGTGLAFQIRMLREKKGWTQEKLATLTGKQQETISQWENPNYGSYTLNSLKSLAAAFDVALLVKFAPFSELVDWTVHLTPGRLAPKSYEEEKSSTTQQLFAAYSIHWGGDTPSWVPAVQEDFASLLNTTFFATSVSTPSVPLAGAMTMDDLKPALSEDTRPRKPEAALAA